MTNGMLEFYRTHSFITNPMEEACQLENLPEDLSSLCRISRQAIIHFQAPELRDLPDLAERFEERHTRDVKTMLQKLRSKSGTVLSQPRPPHQRLIGNCRDHATLLCSLLRQQEIPARVRFGFASYIRHPEFLYPDHVLCEYWDAEVGRWKLVDAEQDDTLIESNGLDFDPLNVPRDRFIVAGQAWQMCRDGQTSQDEFGFEGEMKGVWIIQSYLVHDLAALNKVEFLIQDCWGLADIGPDNVNSKEENNLIDRVAELTAKSDDFSALSQIYSHPRLEVPAEVNCYTDFNQARKVLLPHQA